MISCQQGPAADHRRTSDRDHTARLPNVESDACDVSDREMDLLNVAVRDNENGSFHFLEQDENAEQADAVTAEVVNSDAVLIDHNEGTTNVDPGRHTSASKRRVVPFFWKRRRETRLSSPAERATVSKYIRPEIAEVAIIDGIWFETVDS